MFSNPFVNPLRASAIWTLIAGIVFAVGAPSAETASSVSAYSNRLAESHNPYLLLHADNPVDWYPWGPEAIARARSENKPIFLSVGYSTCYWCHVAERTLYSNPEIAKLMNQWFVNVKVDREQRPDVDRVYIVAQRLIAGTSGWPNNVFLTPDLKPFFAGSYFPPLPDDRSPGFPQVLANIHRAWTTKRSEVVSYAETVHTAMQQLQLAQESDAALIPMVPGQWLEQARQSALKRFDERHGGFVTADSKTRFPESPTLQLLLADYTLNREPQVLPALASTLDAMAFGGIRDQVGGGFHRYSTDSTWSLPHFEKMLYDNAQLLRLYAEAFKALEVPLYRQVALDVGNYLVEQIMSPQGGFFTAQDAQVDGVEGASYFWRRDEIERVLGTEAAMRFFEVYELTASVPSGGPGIQSSQISDLVAPGVLRVRLPIADTLERSGHQDPAAMFQSLQGFRARLLAERNKRRQPLRDEKINVDLNGLAIEAFSVAGKTLDVPAYVSHARRAAERIWAAAYDPKQRRLMHQIYQGRAEIDGFLSDYALFGRALLYLHTATNDPIWLERATLLAKVIVERFLGTDGGVRMTAGGSDLPLAVYDTGDNVYPSGTSATIDLWLRLAAIDKAARFSDPAGKLLRHSASRIAEQPDGWVTTLTALSTSEARGLVAGFATDAEDQTASVSEDGGNTTPRLFGTAEHVRIAHALRQSPTTVAVTLEIDDGYHVNANPASDDYLIPTAMSFEGIKVVHVAYPQAVLFKPSFSDTAIAIYEHKPVIVATFDAAALNDVEVLRGTVTVQACNDELCLPPSKLPVSIILSD